MLKEYKRKTNLGVGVGWVATFVGTLMLHQDSVALSILGIAMLIGGAILFLWGCAQYAKGKGYSSYWGALGLLWILGLLVLIVLPDRNKATR